MGTEIVNNYDALQGELEKAKNNLKGLNDNIRRMIGREPPDAQLRLEYLGLKFNIIIAIIKLNY